MAEQSDQFNSAITSNIGYQQSSALQIRLNTEAVFFKIEKYLSGQQEVIQLDDAGNQSLAFQRTGTPMCNAIGIQGILSFLSNIFNNQVVQGNLTQAQYLDRCYWMRIELTEVIISNCEAWGIDENKLDLIIDSLSNLTELFLSRLIDNLEREGYNQSLKSHEVHQSQSGGWNMNPFSGGKA